MAAKLVICLMGPTATGKTTLAVEMLQQFSAEIISVDSTMIYRCMDIGTAKPSPEVLQKAPHHLINIRDPAQTYSVGEFRNDALAAIEAILQKKRIPLLVGGTLLYFHILQHGIAPLPAHNQEIRQRLQQKLLEQGHPTLHAELQRIDPVAAQRIHTNDSQRLLRALEVVEITGRTLTEIQLMHSNTPLPYQFINIALVPYDRHCHHRLIHRRFQDMLRQGFMEEVQLLFKRGDLHIGLPSIRAVGYRQAWHYLQREFSYDTMQERAIIATRQLAKRQMTWLRSWKNLHLLDYEDKAIQHKFLEIIKTVKNP